MARGAIRGDSISAAYARLVIRRKGQAVGRQRMPRPLWPSAIWSARGTSTRTRSGWHRCRSFPERCSTRAETRSCSSIRPSTRARIGRPRRRGQSATTSTQSSRTSGRRASRSSGTTTCRRRRVTAMFHVIGDFKSVWLKDPDGNILNLTNMYARQSAALELRSADIVFTHRPYSAARAHAARRPRLRLAPRVGERRVRAGGEARGRDGLRRARHVGGHLRRRGLRGARAHCAAHGRAAGQDGLGRDGQLRRLGRRRRPGTARALRRRAARARDPGRRVVPPRAREAGSRHPPRARDALVPNAERSAVRRYRAQHRVDAASQRRLFARVARWR